MSHVAIINEYDVTRSLGGSISIPVCDFPQYTRQGKVLEFIRSNRYYGDAVNGKRYKFKCNTYNGTERADMVGHDVVSGTLSEAIQLGYYNVCSKLPVPTYTGIKIAPNGIADYNTITNVKCQNVDTIIPTESPSASPKPSSIGRAKQSTSIIGVSSRSTISNGNSKIQIGFYQMLMVTTIVCLVLQFQ